MGKGSGGGTSSGTPAAKAASSVLGPGIKKMNPPATKPNKVTKPKPKKPKPALPPGVQRLPSGRAPANSSYAGKKYDGKGWTKALDDKYKKLGHDGVKFTKDGFPDFSPYAKATYRFDKNQPGRQFSGKKRDQDFREANKDRGKKQEPGYTWHHHQDKTTMQLVPTDVHEAVRHAGGAALV